MSVGISGGPTPWWQTTPKMGQSRDNLTKSAPTGYHYDPVQMSYLKNPETLGDEEGTQKAAMLGKLSPALAGLMNATGMNPSPGGPGGPGGGQTEPMVSMPTVGTPGGTGVGGPSAVPQVALPDNTAEQNAVFARAKDRAGQIASSGLESMRGQLAGRGMAGSGADAKGTRDIIRTGMGTLGDVNREQAIQGSKRADEWAKTGYEGGITQRGQDITLSEGSANRAADLAKTSYGGQITQRGQNLNAANEAANRRSAALNGLLVHLY